MSGRVLAWAAVVALGLAPVHPVVACAQAGRPQREAIARGVAVTPDTVTVGDPFRVVVRIRAPRGATLEFPAGPDSGTGVEALDPVAIVVSPDSTATEQTATYRMAAWDVGARAIRFSDIMVRDSAGARRVAVGSGLSVFVRSVLPADSAERVPKPARPLYEFGPPWWWWVLVALIALGVLYVVWRLWRRRRRAQPVVVASALEEAEAAFARIEAMGLLAGGERTLHVAMMADVVRTYLERVLPAATPSLTTSEVLVALRGDGRVPLGRLARLLQDADLVKFAAHVVDATRAEAIGREARAVVQAVDGALAPRAGAPAAGTTREAA